MNVLFIHSNKNWFDSVKPIIAQINIQLGISYISAFLKSNNHNTRLLVLTKNTKQRIIDNVIKEFCPKLICFTAVATEFDLIAKTAQYIKSRYPSIYLLVGGPHATLNPQEVIGDVFDSLCIGEGEQPTLELVEQLEQGKSPQGIKNLWIKNSEGIQKNPSRGFHQDLDSLPFPDRSIWQEWIRVPKSMHTIILGRGCPFQCTYCCNHALRKIAAGRYVRLRSPENILKELREIVMGFPEVKEIYLEVETLGINKDFDIDLCSQLEKFNKDYDQPIAFGANLRITSRINYESFFQSLRKANFSFINIGLESGNERVREEILKRRYSNQDFTNVVHCAKKHGLKVNVYLMVGIPSETLEDFQDTIKCIRGCQPDRADLSIFYPYPGTELYKICEEKKLLNHKISTEYERRIAALDLPGFSRKQIQRQYDWFNYTVYKGYRPLYPLLKDVFLYRKMFVSRVGRIFLMMLSSIKKF